jgi:hypothetical protein
MKSMAIQIVALAVIIFFTVFAMPVLWTIDLVSRMVTGHKNPCHPE